VWQRLRASVIIQMDESDGGESIEVLAPLHGLSVCLVQESA
jgi:hypothetical protein